jgi:hypothetical protein
MCILCIAHWFKDCLFLVIERSYHKTPNKDLVIEATLLPSWFIDPVLPDI